MADVWAVCLLVLFNQGKYQNSELAWTMNTNNVWPRWRYRG